MSQLKINDLVHTYVDGKICKSIFKIVDIEELNFYYGTSQNYVMVKIWDDDLDSIVNINNIFVYDKFNELNNLFYSKSVFLCSPEILSEIKKFVVQYMIKILTSSFESIKIGMLAGSPSYANKHRLIWIKTDVDRLKIYTKMLRDL